MKKRIKKTAMFMVAFGLTIATTSVFFGIKEYQFINTATNVSGTVTAIFSDRKGSIVQYAPQIEFTYNGKSRTFVPNYRNDFSNLDVGDSIDLKTDGNSVVVVGTRPNILGIIIGVISGIIFLIMGLLWMRKYTPRVPEIVFLKNKGNKIHARYMHHEETDQEIDGHKGIILFLKEVDGKRTFQTHPIHSEHTVAWLEEHLFDVYIHPDDPATYYIDMEKHFGVPESTI